MIYAFGNPVYDFIQTPRVKTDGRILSGCSTNFALALAKLDRQVALVGSIGSDYGSQFRQAMEHYGIQGIVSEAAQTGGFSLNYYDDMGNRTLDLLGRAADIDFIPPGVDEADAVLVGPILGETGFDFIRKLRQECRGLMMLDPQGLLRTSDNGAIKHRKPEGIEDIVGLFDIVKPNELECMVLTGIDPREDAETPARELYSWGAKLVVITLAEQGSVVFDGESFWRIPAFPADCVDATGAGDTYAAGFMYGTLAGLTPRECGVWGTAVASVMIEHVGPEFPLTVKLATERTKTLTAVVEVAV